MNLTEKLYTKIYALHYACDEINDLIMSREKVGCKMQHNLSSNLFIFTCKIKLQKHVNNLLDMDWILAIYTNCKLIYVHFMYLHPYKIK